MPLNSVPPTLDALEAKREAARDRLHVDVGFWRQRRPVRVRPGGGIRGRPGRLHHRHPITPYAGHRLTGMVRATFLRGRQVTGDDPGGILLTRGGP
jgi:hypothetical protein